MANFNRVKFTTATTGTSNITVGSAVSSFQTPAGAGMVDGQDARYAIEDGTAWETGTVIASSTATVLARTLEASSTGSLISLSGSATMYFTPTAKQLDALPARGAILALSVGMVLP